jgi:hypothetical protein
MAITKQTMDNAFEQVKEQVKDFFKNLLNPNMKIEDIADVVSSRLDPVIIANEKKGLHYSAGKFYIKSVDDEHFQLEFEMFFKDDDDKWHKLANASELRDIKLLEEGAAKTIQKLKVIEFPINAPEFQPEEKADEVKQPETAKTAEEKIDETDGVKSEEKVEDNAEITIDIEAEVKNEK